MFFLEWFETFFGNFYIIFAIRSSSLFLKTCFLVAITKKVKNYTIKSHYLLLLGCILLGNAASDAAWALKLFRELFYIGIDYRFVLLVIRTAWIFVIIQYHALSLFLENLICQNYIIPIRQKICMTISVLLSLTFFVLMIVDFQCVDKSQILPLQNKLQNFITFYSLFVLFLPSFCIIVYKLYFQKLPAILKEQLKIFLQWLIIPCFLADCIQTFPFKLYSFGWIAHNYSFAGLSTLLLATALYFCARRILNLRFLNLNSHVQQPMNLHFINDFRKVLERLSLVTSLSEIDYLIQTFLKETFAIPLGKSVFYLRASSEQLSKNCGNSRYQNTAYLMETFLEMHESSIMPAFRKEKALVYDEIAFSHFYDTCHEGEIMLKFLRAINADVFLPIYEKDRLIAYIVVEKESRAGRFYSGIERNEFIVLCNYLGNIINLLQRQNLDLLIEQEQTLRKELYYKHQEVNQYKESIRSFLRNHIGQKIGVIFYKNRHFTYGNKEAKDLVSVNFEKQHGHPLAVTLRQLAQQVVDFRSPQTVLAKNAAGTMLVFSGVLHLEQNTIIITVSRPDISDTIKHYLDLLKDPTELDYILYLQTTHSGKLINRLIPGDGPVLLNFKIELLKIALSQKAIYIDASEQDVLPMVELVHAISMREKLHILELQPQCNSDEAAVALFGINPIFEHHASRELPILEQLDGIGTLFIKNIHLLSMEAQEHLIECLRYGYFKVLKSTQKIGSNVRIICSGKNIQKLVHEGKFSKELFHELRTTTISMPSLLTLSDTELETLTDGFIQQYVGSEELHSIFSLTDKERSILSQVPATSLSELKNRVYTILVKKSNKHQVCTKTEFVSAEVTDPDLIAIARLGKQALKDEKVMRMLWNKFKNQNKISVFLNVNRSSVNRRCKEYNLI